MNFKRLFIGTKTPSLNQKCNYQSVMVFQSGRSLKATVETADFVIKLNSHRTAYVWGDLFYYHNSDDSISYLSSASAVSSVFRKYSWEELQESLEGQFLCLLVDTKQKKARIFTDRYSRKDYFYAEEEDGFFLSSDLDLIFECVQPQLDSLMVAHQFLVYGWYVPKPRTIYRGVHRLGVGESIHFSGNNITKFNLPFKPLAVQPHGIQELKTYERYLRESILARANRQGVTWVSSSSGWDSSGLIGILVDELGSKRVKMLSGSMHYSESTKTINNFEIQKIKKIGKYFGIKPEFTTFDYKNKSAISIWEKVLPFFKSRHIYTLVTYNYSRLAQKLSGSGKSEYIFNGETSDSFHNFGFSQFVTFFHTVKAFTEYGDKMNCYLYSPTFLRKVLAGAHESDKVYQIFRRMFPTMNISHKSSSPKQLMRQYLAPLFYGSPRIPLSINGKNAGLTSKAQKALANYIFDDIFPGVDRMSPETLYSWIVYMYHSMHSQGSTVNVQKHAMEMNGHHWRSPYNDLRLVKLLSQAPESWGRGLDFNHTKYPLKWVLKNSIKFPYNLLEMGPHSYLYDVLEGFSLTEEIVYRSAVTDFFRQTLQSKNYRSILDDRYFDLKQMDRVVDSFLHKKLLKGEEFNNLVTLITLSITGWYR